MKLERPARIELASSAWKAVALPLSYERGESQISELDTAITPSTALRPQRPGWPAGRVLHAGVMIFDGSLMERGTRHPRDLSRTFTGPESVAPVRMRLSPHPYDNPNC